MTRTRAFLLAAPLAASLACLAGNTATAQAPEWIDAPLSANTWWDQAAEWKSAVYAIELAAGQALEHMLRMNEGDMIVYRWTTNRDSAGALTAEFHGHTERTGNEPGTVMFYTQHKDGSEQGSLRAPFSGVHGWYLNNESDEALVVNLEVAGYFSE